LSVLLPAPGSPRMPQPSSGLPVVGWIDVFWYIVLLIKHNFHGHGVILYMI
jgi:hypothetical protein